MQQIIHGFQMIVYSMFFSQNFGAAVSWKFTYYVPAQKAVPYANILSLLLLLVFLLL